MPVYVYHCSNCGIQFEQNQKYSDPFLKRCPECGKPTLQKVFTPVSVIYKGSGFYSTDYHSNSGKPSTQAQKKVEEKSGEKKSEAASEVKHETSKAKESTAKKEE
jgi:putative FmdB family regulatory protein